MMKTMRAVKEIDPRDFQSQEGKTLARIVKQLAKQSNEQKDEIRKIKTNLRGSGSFKRR